MSLTDEDEKKCTEILPRMHRHIEEWWNYIQTSRLAEGKKQKNGLVQDIDDTIWNIADMAKYLLYPSFLLSEP